MDSYILFLIGLGAIIILLAWLPMLLRRLPLSIPILCVAFGAVIFPIVGGGHAPLPGDHIKIAEHVTEMIVIIALMGAGLKIDRPVRLQAWGVTWRLLGVAMPLTIAAVALLGWSLLDLGIATALLLAAALAPTDPVLASDVQVGPPRSGEEGEARFALTSEAGLNDGLAFPFVYLAIALALTSEQVPVWSWLGKWAAVDVIWRIGIACLVGWISGYGFGWLAFRLPRRLRLSTTGDGIAALGMTFVAYGLAQAVSAYGFVAVFVAALALRAAEPDHDYQVRLHDFVEQIERLAVMMSLIMFGGALTNGLLAHLDLAASVFAALVVLIVRPIAGWVSLIGTVHPRAEKAVISFFGIRGVGTVYYLAFGLGAASFEREGYLWSIVALVILVSVVIHGVSVTPILRRLDDDQKPKRKNS
jgi:NhaP-type Na+/H+ or K+/H+ antiporter